MDLRGHGNTDWSQSGDYTLNDFSSDVAFLIGELQINPVLVGASLGGLVGIYLEGKYERDSISGLVLVDIVPNMNIAGAERVKDFMLEHSKTGFASLSEVSEILSKYNPHREKSSDLEGLKEIYGNEVRNGFGIGTQCSSQRKEVKRTRICVTLFC